MSQKLPVNGFKWVDERFIKDYDKNSNNGYFLEVDVEYLKKLFKLHSDLSFLPERNKIKKCNKLAYNILDKKQCCSHKSFKTSIKSWINTKKVQRVIQFN